MERFYSISSPTIFIKIYLILSGSFIIKEKGSPFKTTLIQKKLFVMQIYFLRFG